MGWNRDGTDRTDLLRRYGTMLHGSRGLSQDTAGVCCGGDSAEVPDIPMLYDTSRPYRSTQSLRKTTSLATQVGSVTKNDQSFGIPTRKSRTIGTLAFEADQSAPTP